jgi:8-oxo-dGTP diphosphatase
MGAKQQGADATQHRWLTIPRTLSFVMNGDDILMMKRAPHRRVFPNQYNGLGGHIERDEDPLTGAIREIKEESGLDVHSVRLRTIHNIDAGKDTGIMLFVYTAVADTRDVIQDTAEGTLEWIPKSKILDIDLVEDLPYLIPRVLDMDDNQAPLHVHVSYNTADEIQLRFKETI